MEVFKTPKQTKGDRNMWRTNNFILASCLFFVVSIAFTPNSHATLIVKDDNLVYDTELDLYFQRDWLAYTGMSYTEMVASVAESTVGGFTDWELASPVQMLASSIWDYRNLNLWLAPSDLAEIFTPYSADYNDRRSLLQWEGWTNYFEPTTESMFGIDYDYRIETAMLAGTTVFNESGGECYTGDINNPRSGDECYGWTTFRGQVPRSNEQLDTWPLSYGAWVVSSGVQTVPEPSTMVLFVTGLCGFICIRLRKNK